MKMVAYIGGVIFVLVCLSAEQYFPAMCMSAILLFVALDGK